MKNLKKLMSVILTVAMLMSFVVSTSAATFTDVAETDTAYEAIEVLAALDILEGKEDGNFDPAANIKRSEFAAVICRAMNAETAASGSVADFTDVSADHWAAGYIGWAADSEIVNGMGDGTFAPDANVTYQQAVKMIVAAMGFSPMAEKRGGYPTGYMAIANSYNITKGVAMTPATAAATRAGVAQLVYNAFDAPLMDASVLTFSDETEYMIYDGGKASDYTRKTLLSQYHDIYKVKATVDATYRSNSSYNQSNGKKYMLINPTNLYKFSAADFIDELGFAAPVAPATTATGVVAKRVLANNTDWAAYLGYTVNAYITVNEDGETEVIALVPDTKSIETIEIANPKADIVTNSISGTTVTFEYWANENKTETVPMAASTAVKLYVNGTEIGTIDSAAATEFAALNGGTYSSVTLLGNKSTGVFDKILVTQYAYSQVKEVDAEAMTILTDQGEYVLDPDELHDQFVYNIYKDGKEIGLEDIAEGDILNVISDDTDFSFGSTDYFAEIYVTSNVLESSISMTGTNAAGEAYYMIDGTEYVAAPGQSLAAANKAGAAGLFYITVDGYLYASDLNKASSGNYAFILDIAKNTSASFGAQFEIKLLTKNNDVVIMPVKDSVRVTVAGAQATYKVTSATPTETQDYAFGTTAAIWNSVGNNVVAVSAANIGNRVVTYRDNGSEITDIVFAKTYATSADSKEFNVSTQLTGKAYNATANRLDNYYLQDNTVIFNAEILAGPSIDPDKVQVYPANSLDEDVVGGYNGFVYDIDDDKAVGAILISNDMGFAGKANALAVAMSISDGLDAAGVPTKIYNFFQAGEFKSVAADNNYTVALTPGDVFQYTTTEAGEINEIEVVFDMDATYANGGSLVKTADGDIDYMVGVVTGIGTKYADIAYADTDANDDGTPDGPTAKTGFFGWDLDAAASNTLFEIAKANNLKNAISGKTGTGYIREAKVTGSNYTSDVYVVVAKVDNGSAVEVVTFKYAKDATRVAATFNGLFKSAK